MFKIIALFFVGIFITLSECGPKCTLPVVRKCTHGDTSMCCQPLVDPNLNMELGITAGDVLMSAHLINPKSSGNVNCGKTLGRMPLAKVLETMSSLIKYKQSLFESKDKLQMDVALAVSYLLTDLQNKTCDWISECLLIPPQLSCEDYLTHYAMMKSLKDHPNSLRLSCGSSKTVGWCKWWMEKAVCQEDETIAFKKGYSGYYYNGPYYTCSAI